MSCAMPPASVPMALSLSDWRSCSSALRRSSISCRNRSFASARYAYPSARRACPSASSTPIRSARSALRRRPRIDDVTPSARTLATARRLPEVMTQMPGGEAGSYQSSLPKTSPVVAAVAASARSVWRRSKKIAVTTGVASSRPAPVTPRSRLSPVPIT